jgi:hypothetical protein
MTSRSTWGTKIINKDVIRIKIVNGMWKMGNAMEPFHAAATHLYMSFQKYIQTREHNVNNW